MDPDLHAHAEHPDAGVWHPQGSGGPSAICLFCVTAHASHAGERPAGSIGTTLNLLNTLIAGWPRGLAHFVDGLRVDVVAPLVEGLAGSVSPLLEAFVRAIIAIAGSGGGVAACAESIAAYFVATPDDEGSAPALPSPHELAPAGFDQSQASISAQASPAVTTSR